MSFVGVGGSGRGKTSIVYCDCCGESFLEHQVPSDRSCKSCKHGKVVKESREV